MLHKVPVFFLMFIVSCIDPLDINIDEEVNVLIVEGAITTGPGPHKIRLSRSARYGGIFDGAVLPVNRALVSIRDSDGNNFPLTEESFRFSSVPQPARPNAPGQETYLTGVYATTNNFSAIVGNTYTLLIRRANGIEYTSLPETAIPATDILQLRAQFKKVPVSNSEFKTGFDVYATIQDAVEEQNFYMWKNSGLYKISTRPDLRMCPGSSSGPANDQGIIAAVPCPTDCCFDCWVSESSADRSLHLLSDRNVNGNLVAEQVAFIEDDRLRFFDKYLVKIELHTLNREAYQFFDLMRNQLSINGDIFDPPPATLRGNMINLTSPDENVIGYFRASDVRIDSMFLTREMLLEPRPLQHITDDCRLYKSGVAAKPSYW